MSIVEQLDKSGFTAYYRVLKGDVSIRRPSRPMSSIRAEKKADVLIRRMEELDYSLTTIQSDRWFLGLVTRRFKADDSGAVRFERYRKIYRHYASKKKYRPELTIVRRWMLFDLYDVLPVSELAKEHARAAGFMTTYDQLCPEFARIVDDYVRAGKAKNLKSSTIRTNVSGLGRCLLYLQVEEGILSANSITEQAVRRYKIASGNSNASIHRLGRMFQLIGANCAFCFYGKNSDTKKVYQGLTKEEINLFKHFVHTTSMISHRDKAVCMMLLYYGWRSSDIQTLNFSDIHWEQGYIEFRQHKTGQYVTSPLLPEIESAMKRYLQDERPKCDLPYVFVSSHFRRGVYACVNPAQIVNSAFEKCGIRLGNRKKGTHILRHALATGLLDQGEDLSVISDILGHTRVSSSEAYLATDIEGLRSCALAVADYPIRAQIYTSYTR